MNIGRVIRGFSNTTEEMVFEHEINESLPLLQDLFELPNSNPVIDVMPIKSSRQKKFFASKYDIQFQHGVEYYLHAYQK